MLSVRSLHPQSRTLLIGNQATSLFRWPIQSSTTGLPFPDDLAEAGEDDCALQNEDRFYMGFGVYANFTWQ